MTSSAVQMIEPGADRSPLSVNPELIEERFKAVGALLLRGFEFDVDMFRVFSERLCATSVFNESPNRRTLDPNSTIQTVDIGTEEFPLHPELSREPWRPDACLFACFDAPATGGETTLCDGVAIVDHLPHDLAERLRDRHLLYIQPAFTELLETWLGTASPSSAQLRNPPRECPYFFIEANGRVLRGFQQPVLHRPLFTDSLAFGNFLLFARDFLNLPNFPCLENGDPFPAEWLETIRTVSAPLTHAHPWRRGDILILDNSRYMHGRRRITDPGARSIASYFGYVRFASAARIDFPDGPWRRELFRPPVRRTAPTLR